MYRKPFKLKPVKKNCPYCKENREPDYKNVEEMGKYVTERGKIMGKDRTGICNKHQQRVAMSVKRARHLAYLPFVSGL